MQWFWLTFLWITAVYRWRVSTICQVRVLSVCWLGASRHGLRAHRPWSADVWRGGSYALTVLVPTHAGGAGLAPAGPEGLAYHYYMELARRDLLIVQHVARFKQMTSAQLRVLLFNDCSSHTPLDRALRRLVSTSYLIRIERRAVGGARGGSGQYVYALGRRGYFTFYDGRYSPMRSINYHSLAIGDAYVQLSELHRAGRIVIHGATTEPDCWVTVAGNDLRPDLFMDMDVRGQRLKVWLEVDLGTEGQKQLRGKLEAYWRAYNDADANEWPEFPRVLFVATDAERAKELRWLIGQGPRGSAAMFGVTVITELQQLF